MKRWILGITGGIAAYKTPTLVRLMKQQGWDVRVVLSQGAQDFVTPLTLQAVSGAPVYQHILDHDTHSGMGHIELARWADGIVIAPLSANRLAALAHGMADDLLTTLCLATKAPLFVAPAMNQQMWHHPATQQNVALLKSRQVTFIGPGYGEQACGDVGLGRMEEPEYILQQLCAEQLTNESLPLKGKTVLITAGPTQEYFDPIRYISNRSSGKMGFALAQAAVSLGATVKLVTGPVSLPTPPLVMRTDVITADEMYRCVVEQIAGVDLFISAAAVCDFKPENQLAHKIKKNQGELTTRFIRNPDILATIAQSTQPHRPICVGFAAETDHHLQYAQEKLQSKQLDAIVINDVSRSDIGFDSDENAVTVLTSQAQHTIDKGSKLQVAKQILLWLSSSFWHTHLSFNSENTYATHPVKNT